MRMHPPRLELELELEQVLELELEQVLELELELELVTGGENQMVLMNSLTYLDVLDFLARTAKHAHAKHAHAKHAHENKS